MKEVETRENKCELAFECWDSTHGHCLHRMGDFHCKYRERGGICKSKVAQVNAAILFVKRETGAEIK